VIRRGGPTLAGSDPQRAASYYDIAPSLAGRRSRKALPSGSRHDGDRRRCSNRYRFDLDINAWLAASRLKVKEPLKERRRIALSGWSGQTKGKSRIGPRDLTPSGFPHRDVSTMLENPSSRQDPRTRYGTAESTRGRTGFIARTRPESSRASCRMNPLFPAESIPPFSGMRILKENGLK